MMLCLANELKARGKVIVTTSTRILPPRDIRLISKSEPFDEDCVCFGIFDEANKLKGPKDICALESLAPFVIVEADGSKMLPIKAHLAHEPVIPRCAYKTILVVGASGFMQPIEAVCHRAERFCALAGCNKTDLVTPTALCRVIAAENLGDCIFVNQVETQAQRAFAQQLKQGLSMPVYMGQLKKEDWSCVY